MCGLRYTSYLRNRYDMIEVNIAQLSSYSVFDKNV